MWKVRNKCNILFRWQVVLWCSCHPKRKEFLCCILLIFDWIAFDARIIGWGIRFKLQMLCPLRTSSKCFAGREVKWRLLNGQNLSATHILPPKLSYLNVIERKYKRWNLMPDPIILGKTLLFLFGKDDDVWPLLGKLFTFVHLW